MGSIFTNIFTPDAEIDVIFITMSICYYMKWIVENETQRTVIPMIGPIAPAHPEYDIYLGTYTGNELGEPLELILYTPCGIYNVYSTDFYITDWENRQHFVENTPLATVVRKPPKKKMTLKEIEKELGYEIELTEEQK